MRATIRPRYALTALLASAPAMAQPPDPIAAIRADRWSDAQLAASSYADPVATKLVNYFRLLTPGAATAAEITDFMAQNPDWPNQALLERRRQEAIAAEPDLASTSGAMRPQQADPAAGDAALRRSGGECRTHRRSRTRRPAAPGSPASPKPPAEAAFLHRWSGALRQDDQWVRFQHLAWRDAPAAEPAGRAARPGTPGGSPKRASPSNVTHPTPRRCSPRLPAAARSDPGMVLDHARWLRHADRTADALALWQHAGATAQKRRPGR